jgi:hypothetical protein
MQPPRPGRNRLGGTGRAAPRVESDPDKSYAGDIAGSLPGSLLAAPGSRGYKTAHQRNRSVAQSGSAPRSGRGGRRFKSCHSDQLSHDNDAYGASYGERNPIPSLFGAANPNLLTLLTFRRPFVPRSTSPAGQRLPHVGLGQAECRARQSGGIDLRFEGGARAALTFPGAKCAAVAVSIFGFGGRDRRGWLSSCRLRSATTVKCNR